MSHGAPAGSALLFATAEETLVETLGDVHAALDDAGCGYAGPTPLKPMDGPALEAFLDHLADPDAATTARPDRFPGPSPSSPGSRRRADRRDGRTAGTVRAPPRPSPPAPLPDPVTLRRNLEGLGVAEPTAWARRLSRVLEDGVAAGTDDLHARCVHRLLNKSYRRNFV
jgi:hypothetical protein